MHRDSHGGVMRIILSTRNQTKAEQIKVLLRSLSTPVVTLEEAGIEGEAVEDGSTLEENATKKALFAWENRREWVIAEDTGLFIDALDGKPGVYPARWAGEHKTWDEIRDFTLEQLSGVPDHLRTAVFRTSVAVVSPIGGIEIFTGETKGVILSHARCATQPHMPYSAIYLPDGSDKVWAEMTIQETNDISHRGKAMREAAVFLRKFKL